MFGNSSLQDMLSYLVYSLMSLKYLTNKKIRGIFEWTFQIIIKFGFSYVQFNEARLHVFTLLVCTLKYNRNKDILQSKYNIRMI